MSATLAFVMAALDQEPAALRWAPKQGDRLTYEYRLETSGPQPSRLTAFLDITVIQKTSGGFTTKTVSRGALVTMMGSDLKDTRQNPVTARFGLRGELLEILEGLKDRGAYDLGRLTKFVAPPNPVKVGDSWTFDYPSDGEATAAKWTGRFEGLVAGAAPSRARVSVSIAEAKPGKSSFTAKGEWEIDMATGRPEKLKAEMNNIGGSPAAGGIKIALTRMTDQDR